MSVVRRRCYEMLDAYVARPAWNLREFDRQAVLVGALRADLDRDGVLVEGCDDAANRYSALPGHVDLRTSRVHAELKILVQGDNRPRNRVPRSDIVVLGDRPVRIRRDEYGAANFELAIDVEFVDAVLEVKVESLDFRYANPDDHGARLDLRKLIALASQVGAGSDGETPLFGMLVLDAGLPVGPLGYRKAWHKARRSGWEWPQAGGDADGAIPEGVRVRCWSLGLDADDALGAREWFWSPSGWSAVSRQEASTSGALHAW